MKHCSFRPCHLVISSPGAVDICLRPEKRKVTELATALGLIREDKRGSGEMWYIKIVVFSL